MSGGETGEEMYEQIVSLYRSVGGFLGWKECGMLLARGLETRDAIEQSGLLEQAENMGRNA